MITMQAPPDHNGEVSYQGDRYAFASGTTVSVPDHAVAVLRSHGYVPKSEWDAAQATKPREVESDDDLVEDTDLDPADSMTKAELIAYLRAKGIGISKGMSVGGLRTIVRENFEEDERAQAEPKGPFTQQAADTKANKTAPPATDTATAT